MAQELTKTKKTKNHAIGFSVGYGVGLGTGTAHDYAIDYSYKFNKNFSLTGRFHLLDVQESERSMDVFFIESDADFQHIDVDFKNFDVFFSWYPLGSSFRIIGGFGYFFDSFLEMHSSFEESIIIEGIELRPRSTMHWWASETRTGEIEIQMEWPSIAPYFGIGFGRAVPKNSELGLEIGAYLRKPPNIEARVSNVGQARFQSRQLEQKLPLLVLHPHISLRLSRSF